MNVILLLVLLLTVLEGRLLPSNFLLVLFIQLPLPLTPEVLQVL